MHGVKCLKLAAALPPGGPLFSAAAKGIAVDLSTGGCLGWDHSYSSQAPRNASLLRRGVFQTAVLAQTRRFDAESGRAAAHLQRGHGPGCGARRLPEARPSPISGAHGGAGRALRRHSDAADLVRPDPLTMECLDTQDQPSRAALPRPVAEESSWPFDECFSFAMPQDDLTRVVAMEAAERRRQTRKHDAPWFLLRWLKRKASA